MSEKPTIWDRVDDEIQGFSFVGLWKVGRQGGEAETSGTPRPKKWSRGKRLVVDIVAASFWFYVILKLFAFDVDRVVLERLPWGDWSALADYRWLVTSVLVIVLAVFVRPLRKYFLYVATFPLILAFWKLPKLMRRIRSPVSWVAVAHALTSFTSGLRWNLVAVISYFLAFVAIAWTRNEIVLVIASLVVTVLMARTFYRVLRFSIGPDRFLRINRDGIRRFVDSERFVKLMQISDDLRTDDDEKFTAEQQSNFTMKLSFGIAVQRGVLFWAHQLDRYRKSPSLYLFGFVSFVWLSIVTVTSLSLLNLAVMKIDPGQFDGGANVEGLDILLYTINSMNLGSGSQLVPDGTWAVMLSVVGALINWVILGALILNFVMTYRQAQQETAFRDAVVEIRAAGRSADVLLAREYRISVREAISRLESIGGLFVDLILFFTSRLPQDYLDDDSGAQESVV